MKHLVATFLIVWTIALVTGLVAGRLSMPAAFFATWLGGFFAGVVHGVREWAR